MRPTPLRRVPEPPAIFSACALPQAPHRSATSVTRPSPHHRAWAQSHVRFPLPLDTSPRRTPVNRKNTPEHPHSTRPEGSASLQRRTVTGWTLSTAPLAVISHVPRSGIAEAEEGSVTRRPRHRTTRCDDHWLQWECVPCRFAPPAFGRKDHRDPAATSLRAPHAHN